MLSSTKSLMEVQAVVWISLDAAVRASEGKSNCLPRKGMICEFKLNE